MTDLILSSHAVPTAVRRAVPASDDRIELVLHELRGLGVVAVARRMAALQGHTCWILVEDIDHAPMSAVLSLFASCLRFRELKFFDGRGRVRPVSRAGVLLKTLPAILRATAAAEADRWRCDSEVAGLQRATRQHAALVPASDEVVYLKVNVAHGFSVGGSVGHVAGVVNALARHHKVRFFTSERPALLGADVAVEQVTGNLAIGYPPAAASFTFQRRFTDEVAERVSVPGRVRLVYQRLFTNHYSGVVLARRWRKPLVVEYNGSEAWAERHWGRRMRFERQALAAEQVVLRHAHVVVVVSNVLRDEVIARGVEPDRVVSYPNCVDPGMFDPQRFQPSELAALRRAHGIPEDATVVTFMGTFGRWHGVDVLARAVRGVIDEQPRWLRERRVYFWLIGDGLLMGAVRRHLADERCRSVVGLPGLVPQAEAPKHLAASDILVSPHVRNSDGSRFFGSPTKLFEYMAMGKGIVASRLEQLAEVLTGGVTVQDLAVADGRPPPGDASAVLVEPGDVQELITGIRFLAERPDWRAELGATARRRVLERYTWKRHVDAILEGVAAVS